MQYNLYKYMRLNAGKGEQVKKIIRLWVLVILIKHEGILPYLFANHSQKYLVYPISLMPMSALSTT